MTLRRTALWCGAALAVLLTAAAIAAAWVIHRPELLLPLVRRALSPAGGDASLAGIGVTLDPPAVTLSGLVLAGRPQGDDLLRLDRLRVEWDPSRILRGGPRWRSVEATGLVFERRRPQESKGPPDLTPIARLFDIERLSVDDARLRWALPHGTLAVDGLRLSVLPGEGGTRRVSGEANLTFSRNGSAVAAGRVTALGEMTPGPFLDFTLDASSARLELPWISADVSGRTILRLTRKQLLTDDLRLTLMRGRLFRVSREREELGPIRLAVAGSTMLDGTEPRLEVRELDLGGMLRAQGRIGGATLDGLSGTAEGEVPRVERAVALAASLFPGRWKDSGVEGKIRFRLRLETGAGVASKDPRLGAAISLERIGFGDPAGDVMARNLSGRIDVDARLGPRPRVSANLTMGRGEALWGTVYVDLTRHPLDIHAAGTRGGPGEYEEVVLEGGLAGLCRLSIRGNAQREAGNWRHRGRLALTDTPLGPVFRILLKDPLASSRADLAQLRMDGTARMDLAFSGSGKTIEVQGRLRLRSGDLRREGESPVVSGLDLDLPIAYAFGGPSPGSPAPPGRAGWGRLRLSELRIAGETVGPLEIPVALVPNRLYIGGSVSAPLFGGNLSLQNIRVDDPFSPAFRVHLAARMDGLDLARIAGQDSKLEGRLGGLLDPVLIGRERLTSSGDLAGTLFGGRLGIRRVTVERPFDPGREFGSDLHVSLLDLERLSAAYGVGRITGRFSGSLEGLRLAYGQPVAFHLKARSVPVEGVNQSISLKAVDSISLVSTGSPLSGAGSSMVTRLFREYPYEAIGIECLLRNDVFTLRGLIHEGGLEYLVKRRFAGINVINRNPDNRIGFSDMLERAKRATGERLP